MRYDYSIGIFCNLFKLWATSSSWLSPSFVLIKSFDSTVKTLLPFCFFMSDRFLKKKGEKVYILAPDSGKISAN